MSIVDLFDGIIWGFIPDFDKWVWSSKGGGKWSTRHGYKWGNRTGSWYARQKAFNKKDDNKRRALMDSKEATRFAGADRFKF